MHHSPSAHARRLGFSVALALAPSLCVSLTMAGCAEDAPRRNLGSLCSSDGDCEGGLCGAGVCLDPQADEDGDGLANAVELALFTNPTNPDTDGDGTGDRDELDSGLATVDGDTDGTADVLESATRDDDNDCIPNQFDPRNAVPDTDLSGLVDIVCRTAGVCAASASALVVVCDAAGDAKTARCDYAGVADFEADEVTCDGRDNDCDGVSDEDAGDLDDDGSADCVDADDDGDGAADDGDLCPLVADPAQGDGDGDGRGDACDPPLPPIVSGIEPRSPAADPAPTFSGTSDASGAVEVFATADCSGAPLASGAADATGAFAITVAAAPNGATRVFLRAANAAGLRSSCVPSGYVYVHDDLAPAAPTFVAIEPLSPSGELSPSVSGRTEPAADVALFDGACTGDALALTTADALGDFAATIVVAPDRTTEIHARASDAAGNDSACARLTSYVHAAAPPAPPSAHADPFAPASPAAELRPSVRGCATAGTSVELYGEAGCLGALLATALADRSDAGCATGSGFEAEVEARAGGTLDVSALVRSEAGIASPCIPLGRYVHDATAPSAPTFISASPPSPSAVATPALFGSAEAASTITLHSDTACAEPPLATAYAGPDGRFGTVVSLATGATTAIFARAVDAADNASPCAPFTSYVHDTSVPAAPSAHPTTPFAPASPSRADSTPTVRGCAASGASVSVFVSDGCTGAPVATVSAATADAACAGASAFTADITVAAPLSSTTVRAQVVDARGVASACATLGTYRFDATAPAAPVLGAITPTSPSASTTPVVTGTAEAGAVVTLYNGSGCSAASALGSATAAASGAWTIAGALDAPNATTTFHADAKDDAGNVSPCATLGAYVHDATTPPAPSAHPSAPWTPASPSRTDFTPALAGCAPSGASVAIFTSDGCTGAAIATFVASRADAACTTGFAFSGDVTVARPSSTTTYRGRVVSAVGASSACVTLGTFVYDSAAPAPPVAGSIAPASPSSATTPVVIGTAEAGSTVRVFSGAGCAGTPLGEVRTGADGSFAVPATAARDVANDFSGNATDAAGNTSSCAALGSFVNDSTPPAAPFMTGSQQPPQPSNDTTLDLRFCAEAGATVDVYTRAGCTGTAVAATAGAGGGCTGGATVQQAALTVSDAVTVYTRARDVAGNSAGCQPLFTYDFDDEAPDEPEITRIKGVAWTFVTPPSAVATVDLEIVGQTEPGATVDLVVDGTVRGSADADADGRFVGLARNVSVQAAGNRVFTALATDEAGNVSDPSAARTVVGLARITVSDDGAPVPGLVAGFQLPDGTGAVEGTTSAAGVFERRIFAGMMVTVAHQEGADTVTRYLHTWQDLMPGDDIPVDITPEEDDGGPTSGEQVLSVDLSAVNVPADVVEYAVQTVCGEDTTSGTRDDIQLSVYCVDPGDTVKVLALAVVVDTTGLLPRPKVAAYAFRDDVVIDADGTTDVTMGPWLTESSPGSTLVSPSLDLRNSTDGIMSGFLNTSNYAPTDFDDDFTISQSGEIPSVLVGPGQTQSLELPFISELGPWRYVIAINQGLQFDNEGFTGLSYLLEIGTGVPPASFGTVDVKADMLPIITPNFFHPPGDDPDRPSYGWITATTLERADAGTATLRGEHDCTRRCFNSGEVCTDDLDCPNSGDSCSFDETCNGELEWTIAWRPWDAEATLTIPEPLATLPEPTLWRIGDQDDFEVGSFAWVEFDFTDGWDEARLLGLGVFVFGDRNPLDTIPDEARVLITFIGGGN